MVQARVSEGMNWEGDHRRIEKELEPRRHFQKNPQQLWFSDTLQLQCLWHIWGYNWLVSGTQLGN